MYNMLTCINFSVQFMYMFTEWPGKLGVESNMKKSGIGIAKSAPEGVVMS